MPTRDPAGLEESLVVMDIADRMRRRADTLDQASDYAARRQALHERLSRLYAAQGIEIDSQTLDRGQRGPPGRTLAALRRTACAQSRRRRNPGRSHP
ncbi:DUF6384 family protein [Salinisphaera sp. S4-8]|uniref:DUF6384 family protein n=1 Tax=Salinisphaera sp. S4-8 TaxID=633357 RepID=UPI00333F193D